MKIQVLLAGLGHWAEKRATFFPYRVKKQYSTLEMDTFKVMLLLSYLAHDFISPYLDIEITISGFSQVPTFVENMRYILQ